MSLLSSSSVLITIGSENLTIKVITKGFSPKVITEQTIQFSPDPDNHWLVATQRLDSVLTAIDLPKKADLKITLMSEYVRYTVLPPQQVNMREDEKKAYASAAYEQIFGEVASSWAIAMQDSPPNKPTICVAVDQEFVTALKTIADTHGLMIATIEPFLMTAVNFLQNDIRRQSGYLAMVENSRLLLLKLDQGEISNVRCDVIVEDWQVLLKQMMMRESVFIDVNGQEEGHSSSENRGVLLVYAPLSGHVGLTNIEGWKVKQVKSNIAQHVAMQGVPA